MRPAGAGAADGAGADDAAGVGDGESGSVIGMLVGDVTRER
jgi:hypothetical protein